MKTVTKKARILLVGGGSGGHVTPLKAVAESLASSSANLEIKVITDRKFYKTAKSIFEPLSDIKLTKIFSGKYRRYAGKSALWHVTHLPTLLNNIKDVFLLCVGFLQSFVLMVFHRPAVIFSKGGFVAVPIGLAARLLRIPLIIHDSDTHPGLTNRLLAGSAKIIATGMPVDYYSYPKDKMVYTGIPVAEGFKPITESQKTLLKDQLGLKPNKKLLLVTGGGTGSAGLNKLVSRVAEKLLLNIQIVQLTGQGKNTPVEAVRSGLPGSLKEDWHIFEFVPLLNYVLSADLIISRTGASAMQEFANAAKPVITIPGKQLAGGHQVKNAKMFADARAVEVIDEDEAKNTPELLLFTAAELIEDQSALERLSKNLSANFAKPDASSRIADLILDQLN